MNDDDFKIEEGSGNVFADLGLPNPEKRLKKAEEKYKQDEDRRARAAVLDKLSALDQELGLT